MAVDASGGRRRSPPRAGGAAASTPVRPAPPSIAVRMRVGTRRSRRQRRRPQRRRRRRLRSASDALELQRTVARRTTPPAACVGRQLQRRRAAHDGVGRVDRHVGDALERVAPASAAAAPSRCVVEPRRTPLVAERLGAHLVGDSKAKPGRPSRLPSTRSTFQAGRVSPSGLTTRVEALHAAFGVDEGARRFGERRDRQQHVAECRGWP